MKRMFILLSITLLASCGSKEDIYVKKIAEVVQTNSTGTKLDLNFKALETEILRNITVADSMKIITDDFDAYRNKYIANIESTDAITRDMLSKAKAARHPSKTMITHYEAELAKSAAKIDSLKAATPPDLERYANRKADDLLAVVVRCEFAFDDPMSNKRAEDTFDFVLSPDATTCYSKKRVK